MFSSRSPFLVAAVLLLLAAFAVTAQDTPKMKPGSFRVYGAAGKSCRTWMSERGGQDGVANLQWVLGYVTAYGVDHAFQVGAGGEKAGDLRPTSPEEIGRIIDTYCGERHPDSSLWPAADDLIRQLGGTRPTPPVPPRPVIEYR